MFALAGRVANTGLIEVPMGITLREIIFDIGGGIPDGRAVQGRADRRAVGRLHSGAAPGLAGGLRIAGQGRLHHGLGRHDRHGRDLLHGGRGQVLHGVLHDANRAASACRAASAPRRCYDLLEAHHGGRRRRRRDLALLEELCDLVRNTSLCGLGQTAPNPVLSTLRYFRDEYLAHIVEKRCAAGVCKTAAARRRRQA